MFLSKQGKFLLPVLEAVFRIRICFNASSILGQIEGFDDQKLKKNYS